MHNMDQPQIPPGMLLRIIQAKQNLAATYEQLHKMTSDQQDIQLIRNINLDETGHLIAFINLYTNLFDEKPYLSDPKALQIGSFLSGVRDSIMEELNLYIIYSNIIFTESDTGVRNVFLQALTDDNRHASRLNYVYTKTLESKLP